MKISVTVTYGWVVIRRTARNLLLFSKYFDGLSILLKQQNMKREIRRTARNLS